MNFLCRMLIALAIVFIPLSEAKSQDKEAKKLMGDNYDVMQRILINLIKEHHDLIVKDIDIIIDHSKKISQMRINLTPEEHEQFRSFAYLLQTRAQNLKIISLNIKEKKQESTADVPKMDYLRDVAAAHFGEVVAMCVRCHNQFR